MRLSYQHAIDPAVRFAWDPCSDVVVVTLSSKSMDEEQLRSYAEAMVERARKHPVGDAAAAQPIKLGGAKP